MSTAALATCLDWQTHAAAAMDDAAERIGASIRSAILYVGWRSWTMVQSAAHPKVTSLAQSWPIFLGGIHDRVDINRRNVLARRRPEIAGIDRQREVQGGKGTENQTELSTGLAVLDGHDPLPSDSRLAGELGLAQLEAAAPVADGQPEVQGSSDLHNGPMSLTGSNIHMSPNDDKTKMSSIDDTLMRDGVRSRIAAPNT